METKPTKGAKIFAFVFIALVFFGVSKCVDSCFEGEKKPDYSNMTPAQIDSIKHVETISKQFSAWDGSHIKTVQAIKDIMNDPNSFEHVETTYRDISKTELNKPGLLLENIQLLVYTKFRGKNGFGGVITQTYISWVDKDGNVVKLNEYKP